MNLTTEDKEYNFPECIAQHWNLFLILQELYII